MYSVSHYSNVNIQATAYLCEYIINETHTIETIIVASSRSIYGEGKYSSPDFVIVYPKSRTHNNIIDSFEVPSPTSGNHNLTVKATGE